MSKSGFGGKPGAKNQVSQSSAASFELAASSAAKKARRVLLNSKESSERRDQVAKYYVVMSGQHNTHKTGMPTIHIDGGDRLGRGGENARAG